MRSNMYDSDFASRIDFAIEKIGGLSKASALIGTSLPTIGRWKDGTSDPKMSNMSAFAKAAGVSLDWLMTGKGTPDGNTQQATIDGCCEHDNSCQVPYYKDVVASAGGGKFSDGVISTDDYLILHKDWTKKSKLSTKDLVAIDTKGDSMLPTIPENATVLVDKSKNIVKDGGIYVVRIDNDLYVKRIQRLPTGLRLISDNKAVYDPIDITKVDLKSSDIQIYGQVVHISYDLPH